MKITRKDALLESKEYSSLFEGRDIILLGYGGSYAYGTNIEGSDIDIRGIYMNPEDEVLGIRPDSEQYVAEDTDTVIYSLRKMLKLLMSCNPNTIEILGLREQDYLYMTDIGQMILDRKDIFLSRKAEHTFGAYAKSQLNRLMNKSGRANDHLEENEARSVEKVLENFWDRYKAYGTVNAYPKDGDVLFDIDVHGMPIEKTGKLLNEINAVERDYKRSVRNDKAIEHNKLNKHMMHLIRLYMMGIDIMGGEIRTYRDGADHELLMSIRNGDYLEGDMKTPTPAFGELVHDYEKRFDEACRQSQLPEEPDIEQINDLSKDICRKAFG